MGAISYSTLTNTAFRSLPLQERDENNIVSGGGLGGDAGITTEAVSINAAESAAWLPHAMRLRGNCYATAEQKSWVAISSYGLGRSVAALSLSLWFRIVERPANSLLMVVHNADGSRDRLGIVRSNSGTLLARASALDSDSTHVQTASYGVNFDDGNWHFATASADYLANTLRLFIDGVLIPGSVEGPGDQNFTASVTSDTNANYTSWVVKGISHPNVNTTDVKGCLVHHSALSLADHQTLYAGPTPTYTSGASFAPNGNFNVGTWDAKSNGLLTYEVVAATAAGDVVASTTGASGAIDLSSVPGQTVYLLVRASNSGGYDVGDYATRVSAYGSADDGYYELASVTATTINYRETVLPSVQSTVKPAVR